MNGKTIRGKMNFNLSKDRNAALHQVDLNFSPGLVQDQKAVSIAGFHFYLPCSNEIAVFNVKLIPACFCSGHDFWQKKKKNPFHGYNS